MVLLRQNKILNVASIVLSLCVMVIFLFIGIFNGKLQASSFGLIILNFNQISFQINSRHSELEKFTAKC